MRNAAATPAASTMYTDWNPTWLRSTPGCPIAYTSTASSTTDAVTSISADSRSATIVIPMGAGQSPACTTTMPRSSTCTRMATEIGTSAVSVLSPMMRWAVREPPTRMHSAAREQRQHDRERQQERSPVAAHRRSASRSSIAASSAAPASDTSVSSES